MDEQASRKDLANALQAVVDERSAASDAARPAAAPAPRGQRGLLIVGLAGAALLAWLWIAQPAAVFAPGDPAFLSAEQREAIARFSLYLERARVEQYVAENGRMPATLADAGPVEAGVEFRSTGADFTLDVRDGAIRLQLTNRMDADSFLGNALAQIPRPKPQ
jgi:hypothetical protein